MEVFAHGWKIANIKLNKRELQENSINQTDQSVACIHPDGSLC